MADSPPAETPIIIFIRMMVNNVHFALLAAHRPPRLINLFFFSSDLFVSAHFESWSAFRPRPAAAAKCSSWSKSGPDGYPAAPVASQGLCGPSAVPATACCIATANIPLHRRAQADVAVRPRAGGVRLPRRRTNASCRSHLLRCHAESPLRLDGSPHAWAHFLGMWPCCKWQIDASEPFAPSFACSEVSSADAGARLRCCLCGALSRCAPAEPHRPYAAPPGPAQDRVPALDEV